MDGSTGVISGTPTGAGVAQISIGVQNTAGAYSQTLAITTTDDRPALSFYDWGALNFGASMFDPAAAGENADPDGDGFTNLQEFLAGTNPLDTSSVPT